MEVRLQPNRDVMLTELGDGTGVLLHLGTKFYFTLNATGMAVWKTLDAGTSTRDGLAEALTRRFRVDRDTALRDLDPLLAEMLNEGLVVRTDHP
jgi:hypothetical protein